MLCVKDYSTLASKTLFCLAGQFTTRTDLPAERSAHYHLYLKFGGWAPPILVPAITKGGQHTKQVCGPRATASRLYKNLGERTKFVLMGPQYKVMFSSQ